LKNGIIGAFELWERWLELHETVGAPATDKWWFSAVATGESIEPIAQGIQSDQSNVIAEAEQTV
jgi:hypothetical protein